MASRIRFPSAASVFEAFPDLKLRAPPPEKDCAPIDHARRLLGDEKPGEAVSFLSYLLPRREAVWWARQCVAGLLGPGAEDEALRAAEIWVKSPDEENRLAAMHVALTSDPRSATTWLARAAAWSGGSMCPPDMNPLPAPPTQCAQAVNAAIVLAATRGDPKGVLKRVSACAEAGIRFADGDQAQLVLPESDEKRLANA